MPYHLTLAERLQSKITDRSSCWIFNNLPSGVENGYGHIRVANRDWKAHRLAYTLEFGPIPAGKVVRHTCDNPACVRPDHLVLGTQKDNAADRDRKNRRTAAKGEAHGRAKLSWEQVLEIRQRAPLMHRGFAALAREYGVTDVQISNVVTGKHWQAPPTSEPA